jgi:hypothetical protein
MEQICGPPVNSQPSNFTHANRTENAEYAVGGSPAASVKIGELQFADTIIRKQS